MNRTITNKTEALLLRKVAEVSQKVVADAIGRDTSTVSRIFSHQTGIHIDEMENFLTAMGLQIIECPGETVTIPKEEHRALKLLASKGLFNA